MKNVYRVIATFLLMLLGLAVPAYGHSTAEHEYQLKAAFILNFAKFTTWPDGSFETGNFSICTLGLVDHAEAFNGLKQKSVHSKQIKLHHLTLADQGQLDQCNLVFMGNSSQHQNRQLFSMISEKPVLLIGELIGFASEGGIIEFVQREERLGFIINQKQAHNSGLEINSSLLSLAVEVK